MLHELHQVLIMSLYALNGIVGHILPLMHVCT